MVPVLLWIATAYAGVTNPDISVIGQPSASWSPQGDPVPTLETGEVEGVLDAALNPYAHGTFLLSLGEEGLELEEGYLLLQRGLPLRLALKAGKYRVGLGRLNPTHPHALPFAARPTVLAAFLPGEESFDEVGMNLSDLIPLVGDSALGLSADWLEGDTFHPDQDAVRPAFAGNVTFSTLLGGRSPVDLGVGATRGIVDVDTDASQIVADAFVKARLRGRGEDFVDLVAEILAARRTDLDPGVALGGFAHGNYTFHRRFNVGASYGQVQPLVDPSGWDRDVGAFAGFGLVEETTLFALDARHAFAGPDRDASDTVTFRAIFSMGPHKPHTF